MRQTRTVAEAPDSTQASTPTPVPDTARAARVSWAVLEVPDEHPKATQSPVDGGWHPRTLILERAVGSHYKPIVRWIAMVIAKAMGKGKDDCYPGIDVIAREAGCSERTVQDVLFNSGICDTDVPSEPSVCRYHPQPWFYRRRRRGAHGFHWHYFLIRSQAGYLAARGERLTKRREAAKQRRMTESDKQRLKERAEQNRAAAQLAAKVIELSTGSPRTQVPEPVPVNPNPTPTPAATPPPKVNGVQVCRVCLERGVREREAKYIIGPDGLWYVWAARVPKLHVCAPPPAEPAPEPEPQNPEN